MASMKVSVSMVLVRCCILSARCRCFFLFFSVKEAYNASVVGMDNEVEDFCESKNVLRAGNACACDVGLM